MPKQKQTKSRQKTLYRVKNWAEYDRALVQRGSITFWLSDDFEKAWLYTGEKQRGSQFEYSDKAIEIMLTLKEVFHLTNRGVEGFVRSLFQVYDALNAHSPDVDILIPPRKNARIWQHGNSKEERLKRDENLRYIRKHGRKQWKQDSGYHVRSLAETIMFRLKIIFGDKLSTRLLETQSSQALIRCLALNKITHLGLPESYLVA